MSTGAAKDEKKEEDSGEAPKEVKELDESEKLVRKILFYKNPFDQLGVTPEMSNDEIRRTFRKLSLKVHPDRCHCEGATEAAMALSKALAVVQDSEQRKPYVELTIRARQKVRDDWERAGRAWRTRISADGDEDDEKQWKEDEEYQYEVKRAVHTMILQIEDRQAAMKKVAEIEEKQAKEAMEQEEEREKQEHERDRKWEKQRDLRVNDWRAFQKQMKQPPNKKARTGGSMAKPLRPPPLVKEARPTAPHMESRRF